MTNLTYTAATPSHFGTYLGCIIAALIFSLCDPASARERPNILLIVVDDQSPFDLKIYDPGSTLETPHIDRLAAEGMVFDAAYHMGSWSGAVCTCSRTMIMSGRTLWHIPGRRRQPGNPERDKSQLIPAQLADQSLPAIFHRAGYATMRTCKRGNSYEAANRRFHIRRDATKRGGTAATGSEWHGDQVLNFLDERKVAQTESPFFIFFGFSHPHDTRDGTPELLAKYGAQNHTDESALPPAHPKQPNLPVNYLPAHPFPHGHPGLRDEVAVRGVWGNRDERTIRNELGRQFACSENIDIQIGRVLDKLAALDELDNTYVIYTSDHGMAIGRHGLQGKQNLYEHTWRVPFIVTGPGIPAATRRPGNIYLLDTLATLCDLTGIELPDTNEGISFKPVLVGEQTTIRDVLYGAYAGGTKPGIRCVRKGDWKLIEYDTLDGQVRESQLFHLAENPHEFLAQHGSPATRTESQIDLAELPEHAPKLAELRTHLRNEMDRLDDPYRLWHQPIEEAARAK